MTKKNNLNKYAQFVLFASSYIPLFILIVFKQISENISSLHWGGLNVDAISICLQKFGLSIFVVVIAAIGYIGYKLTFQKLEEDSPNGDNVTIVKIDNKNNESIGYIATYIVPFLFQSFNGWYAPCALIFLMTIIYRIYINSNLILINPVLSFRYSLFEIEYRRQDGKIKNGLIIIKEKYIDEEDKIKIYEIGFKLFYATRRNNN